MQKTASQIANEVLRELDKQAAFKNPFKAKPKYVSNADLSENMNRRLGSMKPAPKSAPPARSAERMSMSEVPIWKDFYKTK
jgi:hypothetical protein